MKKTVCGFSIGRKWFLSVFAGLLLIACQPSVAAMPNTTNMAEIRADLTVVASHRILFVHQSVGRYLLDATLRLSREAGVQLRVEKVDPSLDQTGPGIFHLEGGTNGDPVSKVKAFETSIGGAQAAQYDIAMMKFCYVDFAADARRPPDLLQTYLRTVDQLRRTHPQTKFIHVTVPLRSDPPGKMTALRRFLGLGTDEDGANKERNAYNTALLSKVSGDAVFDIAKIESTLPDGTRSGFPDKSKFVYVLASEFSKDGGHLNDLGNQRAAVEFVRYLARALRTEKPVGNAVSEKK